MAKAAADHFWNENNSDYVLAVGIAVAMPILRAALDALVFKVRHRTRYFPVAEVPPRGASTQWA